MHVDHFGYVVKDIDSSVDRFINCYNYRLVSEKVYDPKQHVYLAMLESSEQKVELVQPIDKTSPSYGFMKKGGGLHHICYSVLDIHESIKKLKKLGLLLFKPPVEAVLFSSKKVAFLYDRSENKIIELKEA